MSFIIFLVNTLLFSAVLHRKNRFRFLLAAGIIFLSVAFAGFFKNRTWVTNIPSLRISVIQANISPLEKMDLNLFDRNAARHLLLTQRAYNTFHPDLVIWPETAFPDDLLQSAQWRPLIFSEVSRMKTDLLLGIAPIINGYEYNSALLINASGQIGACITSKPWCLSWKRPHLSH